VINAGPAAPTGGATGSASSPLLGWLLVLGVAGLGAFGIRRTVRLG
jgi:hypothetical protein